MACSSLWHTLKKNRPRVRTRKTSSVPEVLILRLGLRWCPRKDGAEAHNDVNFSGFQSGNRKSIKDQASHSRTERVVFFLPLGAWNICLHGMYLLRSKKHTERLAKSAGLLNPWLPCFFFSTNKGADLSQTSFKRLVIMIPRKRVTPLSSPCDLIDHLGMSHVKLVILGRKLFFFFRAQLGPSPNVQPHFRDSSSRLHRRG